MNKCPKCQGEMEQGILGEQRYGREGEVRWGKGFGMLKQTIEEEHKITSYRCKKCGYLESYAK